MGSVTLIVLFSTAIGGQLVTSYGYLALSMYSRASLMVSSLLVFASRLRLNKRFIFGQ